MPLPFRLYLDSRGDRLCGEFPVIIFQLVVLKLTNGQSLFQPNSPVSKTEGSPVILPTPRVATPENILGNRRVAHKASARKTGSESSSEEDWETESLSSEEVQPRRHRHKHRLGHYHRDYDHHPHVPAQLPAALGRDEVSYLAIVTT